MSEIGLTEWNGSKGTLIRIDELLKRCRDSRIMEDYLDLYKSVISLSLEPRSKMLKRDVVNEYNDFRSKLKLLSVLYKRNKDNHDIRDRFSEELFNFEIFLREFMDKKGMLMSENNYGGI